MSQEIPKHVMNIFNAVVNYARATYNPDGNLHKENVTAGIAVLVLDHELTGKEFREARIKPEIKTDGKTLDTYLSELARKDIHHDGAILATPHGIEPSKMVNNVNFDIIQKELDKLPGNGRTGSTIYWSKMNDSYAVLLQSSTGAVNLLYRGALIKQLIPENNTPPVNPEYARIPELIKERRAKIIKFTDYVSLPA